jgi:subtilase family serine protease
VSARGTLRAIALLMLAAGLTLALTAQSPPKAALAPGPGVSFVGPAPANRRVSFDLLLRLPGHRRLQLALAALENPASPRFRHLISPGQYGARFGVSRRALVGLEGWLRTAGVQVLTAYPQRTQLTVQARAGVVERMFHVRLGDYRDRAGHRFTLVRGHIRIPLALSAAVDGVTGLDTRPRLVAHDVPLTGLNPAAAAAAYDVNPLHRAGVDGQGQTIALISFSSYNPADPATFARQNNLRGPAPRVVNVDGGTIDTSEELEANLDIDLIREIAPAARILVYEAPQTSGTYADVINEIVKQRRVSVISSSWGQCELGLHPIERRAEARALSAAVGAGVSTFVASGDQGAYDCQQADVTDHRLSVDWPASSADAVAVGGTRLNLGRGFSYRGETAWEDQFYAEGGGGGISTVDASPVWQAGPGVIGRWSDGRRQIPDVSADADPGTPWAFYADGGTGTESGTSAAAPFWAAAMLLVRQYAARHGIHRIGYVNPILYALARERLRSAPFHDVIRGANRFYPAGVGWDPATGLGSPDVFHLARDVVSYLRRHPAVCRRRHCNRR